MIWVGFGLITIGAVIAGGALWKVWSEEHGSYVVPFVIGMAIAIVGGFVLAGQLLWRLLT